MGKSETIYYGDLSKIVIKFDGEYFQVIQSVEDLERQSISLTKDEIEKMLEFAKKHAS